MRDVTTRLEEIDRQILDLLEERVHIYADMSEDDDGRPQREDEGAVLGLWLEEGADRGFDDLSVEKVCRAVTSLCRKGGE